jgi:hypothetical protein
MPSVYMAVCVSAAPLKAQEHLQLWTLTQPSAFILLSCPFSAQFYKHLGPILDTTCSPSYISKSITLFYRILKVTAGWAGGGAQVGEHLHSKREALSSSPTTIQKNDSCTMI